MGSIILGFPNRIDKATLSGGAYVEAMPLLNLQDRQFARVARSINTATSSTSFSVDFGRQWPFKIFALVAHNLSLSSRYRIEASNHADFSAPLSDRTYDAWPALVSADWDINQLEWENDNYWLGSYTLEDVAGQTAISAQVFDVTINARYWRVTIFDADNSAGFVQTGRLFMSDVFLQPEINYSWSGSLGYEDATAVSTSLSGAEFFDKREPVRVMRFTLGYLSATEGAQALELMRRAGISGEVFVVADPDDIVNGSTRNFLGRFRTLLPLEQAQFEINSMPFEIKELR